MYRLQFRQLPFDQFILPFDGQLDPQYRWIKLAEVTPWFEAERLYAKKFTAPTGMPAYSVRVALGLLIIKGKLCLSDEQTVAQIQENPYLQYFIGFERFTTQQPFDCSMMTHFRKRLDGQDIADIQSVVHRRYHEYLKGLEQNRSQDKDDPGVGTTPVSATVHEQMTEEEPETGNDSSEAEMAGDKVVAPTADTSSHEEPSSEQEKQEIENNGQLIIDATCAPVDNAWPTDLNLLNDAREKSEKVIDQLYTHAPKGMKMPRTYRQKARRESLNMAKKRQKTDKTSRRSIRKQLSCLDRNFRTIDALLKLVPLTVLDKHLFRAVPPAKGDASNAKQAERQPNRQYFATACSIHRSLQGECEGGVRHEALNERGHGVVYA